MVLSLSRMVYINGRLCRNAVKVQTFGFLNARVLRAKLLKIFDICKYLPYFL